MKQYTIVDKLKEEKRQKSRRKTKIIIGIFIGFIVIVVILGMKNLVGLYERNDVDDYDFNTSIEDKSIDDEDTDDNFSNIFGSFVWFLPLIFIGIIWVVEALINPRSLFRRMFRWR